MTRFLKILNKCFENSKKGFKAASIKDLLFVSIEKVTQAL